ncbi:MAG: hypothetical protein K0S93_665 [Nitrososphaeraceae archaeon]|jgi:hypothetical protein|nr:hypothetical protein [Nitrososphaeraceae archaeon]
MLYCKCIKLHNESSWPQLDIDKILSNLKKVFPYNVIEKEKESLLCINSTNKEKNFSFYNHAIVQDLKQPLDIYDLNYYNSSNNIEKKVIESNKKNEFIDLLLYDGFLIQKFLQKLIENDEKHQQYQHHQQQELTLSNINIMITDKLLCTFDEQDWRYHARSLICGNPTLISTSGIVEGIAKPRDYYYKLYFFKEDLDIVNKLKKEYNGQFINYNDPRINDVIEGLVLQSLFYFINSGDPFCKDTNCRFFNAHFQNDLIRVNIKEKKICQRHKILINKYNQSLIINNNRFKNAE